LNPDQDVFEVSYMDLYLLAEELMEFVDHIEIQSPPELAELLKSNLDAVRNCHA
jgi:predicted DNA-binding transcriptional regulator YafY